MKITLILFWGMILFESFFPLGDLVKEYFGMFGVIMGYVFAIAGYSLTAYAIYKHRRFLKRFEPTGKDFKLD